jgi:hypothetical protein
MIDKLYEYTFFNKRENHQVRIFAPSESKAWEELEFFVPNPNKMRDEYEVISFKLKDS